MKEHPILFSSEMVRAILEGRKTQTRRIIPAKLQQCYSPEDEPEAFIDWCRYGHKGDHLWVREAFAKSPKAHIYKADFDTSDGFGSSVVDLNTGETCPLVWKPSIHMPRAVSRITLEIVDVRVERLLNISEQDAIAEGTTPSIVGAEYEYLKYRTGYQNLWNSINEKRGFGWDVNPWVWVIEFKRLEPAYASA